MDGGLRPPRPVYLADYATADDGTGIVHSSSPAYGVRTSTPAWRTAWRYDDILNPVQGNGPTHRLSAVRRPEHLEGRCRRSSRRCATPAACLPPRHHPQLPALLAPQDAGDLPRRRPVVHPHGRGRGRVHKATRRPPTLRQWRWTPSTKPASYPENGKARLRDMIAGRPDWCISRQRSWGVPMPLFLHKDTGELHPRTMEILDRRPTSSKGRRHRGLEQGQRPEDILALGRRRRRTTPRAPTSWRCGSTRHHAHHRAGLAPRQHAMTPGPEADLYLEGHDQHRGWFHSSLLTACAMFGRALPRPADARLHRGQPGPQDEQEPGQRRGPAGTSKKLGAEIIRLWVAAPTTRATSRATTRSRPAWWTYRRIRNTLRFLLANVSDFDPAGTPCHRTRCWRSTATR